MDPYHIVLADDHVMFRQGIKNILEKKKEFEVIGETGDGFHLLDLLEDVTPDLVILDISMPGLRGIEAASHSTGRSPGYTRLEAEMWATIRTPNTLTRWVLS